MNIEERVNNIAAKKKGNDRGKRMLDNLQEQQNVNSDCFIAIYCKKYLVLVGWCQHILQLLQQEHRRGEP